MYHKGRKSCGRFSNMLPFSLFITPCQLPWQPALLVWLLCPSMYCVCTVSHEAHVHMTTLLAWISGQLLLHLFPRMFLMPKWNFLPPGVPFGTDTRTHTYTYTAHTHTHTHTHTRTNTHSQLSSTRSIQTEWEGQSQCMRAWRWFWMLVGEWGRLCLSSQTSNNPTPFRKLLLNYVLRSQSVSSHLQ